MFHNPLHPQNLHSTSPTLLMDCGFMNQQSRHFHSHENLYGTHHYPTNTPPYKVVSLSMYGQPSLGHYLVGYFVHSTTSMLTFGPSHSTLARMDVPTKSYEGKPMYSSQTQYFLYHQPSRPQARMPP